jgi:hypothetical protein
LKSAHQTPLVPADAGTQALLQKLGSRIRGNEREEASAQSTHALNFAPDCRSADWQPELDYRHADKQAR